MSIRAELVTALGSKIVCTANTDNIDVANKLVMVAESLEGAGQTVSQERPSTAELEASAKKEDLKCSSYEVLKIYQRGLEDVCSSRIEDASHFWTESSCTRVKQDFLISLATQRKLLFLSFEDDAKSAYKNIANLHVRCTFDDLSTSPKSRSCSHIHFAALKDRFYDSR